MIYKIIFLKFSLLNCYLIWILILFLTFAKFDGRFAVCFDYGAKKIYYVPKNKIVGNLPEPGEALKVGVVVTFYVDYTAILADENKIDDFLNECK